jgi:hypothetical protein
MYSEHITESESLATCDVVHGRNGKCSVYSISLTDLEMKMPLEE